ncbi:MAG TPA: isoamylase [Kofleriaceae bacterium]|nr:isoamylase [Kofleriaceae bacterium]
MSWESLEGLPYPLGVSWSAEDEAYNFALYSKHATSVHLLAFGADDLVHPVYERALDPLINKSGRIWHCRVPAAAIQRARYYGYVVDGPEASGQFEAHAFHPEKLLLDPYACSIHIPRSFDRSAALDAIPNVGRAPLGVLELAPAFPWHDAAAPHHQADAIIYELHVRGFTFHPSSGVTAAARGTFAGVIEKIPYLRELGVTVVELMPVFQRDPQGGEYWGYMPIGFFAPHGGYAIRDAVREFREMVDALHVAGIEVIIDAVYNHTAEGGAAGPIYSFKGLDNSTYYLMNGDAPTDYADYSGCGNSLNANNRYVRSMILDSMHYWVRDMRVDGFRFDLASVFARDRDGTLRFEDPPIFGEIASEPSFDRVRLIAEPWDAGGAYELGRAFPGTAWLQWNSRFRDDVRRFVRGDRGMVGALMQRLYGSDDLFPDDVIDAYHAYQSVNYVSCHDGFTLYDLLSYEHKHNEANGHGNTDGPVESFSTNCGWEGDDGAPDGVRAFRERQARNLIALLLLSNGTPMLRAGDELLHSQRGNNNAYNQDNATSWLDWSGLERNRAFFRFVKQMIAFRKRHPSLARSRFWRSDVRWFGARGIVELASQELAYCLDGGSQHDDDLYVMINGGGDDVTFVLQDIAARPWRLAIDTASPDDIDGESPLEHTSYVVRHHSVVVLVRDR